MLEASMCVLRPERAELGRKHRAGISPEESIADRG